MEWGNLLRSTQQLRVHWSHMLVVSLTFWIGGAVAAFGFFTGLALSFAAEDPTLGVGLFFFGAGLSTLLLAVWRYHARGLDNQIAALYADLVFYEANCGSPSRLGTRGYLRRELPDLDDALAEGNLNPEQQSRVLQRLWRTRCLGNRGHARLDGYAAVAGLSFLTAAVLGSLQWSPLEFPDSLLLGLGIIFFILASKLLWAAYFEFQRDPTHRGEVSAAIRCVAPCDKGLSQKPRI